MRILHAADLHIDSPLRGLSAYDGAPVDEIRGSTRRAVENLVRVAIDEQVDLVLVAGDIFDGDWRDYGTGLFWIEQLARLDAGGIPVVTIAGNHDAASEISRHLTLPPNVVQLSSAAPQRVVLDDLETEVIGQSYPHRVVDSDLTADFPDGDRGLFTVGLLHTSLTGRANHAPYAPCNPERLRALGYDYWALGHVHNREVVDTEPWIVFPGNTQGRHIREVGPKGATIVEVDSRRVTKARHVDLDVVRWHHIDVPIGNVSDVDEVLERVAAELERTVEDLGGRLGAVRVELTGRSDVHQSLWHNPHGFENEVRALAVRSGSLWLERVKISTQRRADMDRLRRDETVAALVDRIEQLRADSDALESYEELFADLRSKVGADVRVDEQHPFDPSKVGTVAGLIGQLDPTLEVILDSLAGVIGEDDL